MQQARQPGRIWCLAILLVLLNAGTAQADFCPAVPSGAWPSGQAQTICAISTSPCFQAMDCPISGEQCLAPQGVTGTSDTSYVNQWCSTFHPLTAALNLDWGDWDEGHGAVFQNGWRPSCAINDFLTRLLNGAFLVGDVTEHSAPFGLRRWVFDPDGDLSPPEVDSLDRFLGDWFSFIINHNGDEWVPGCNTTDTLATNHHNPVGDDYIALHKLSAYMATALERAGTIVHETVHEDVGHEDDNLCAAGGSCDVRYAQYNAQTMQIDFYYDAATRYLLTELNGQPVRSATWFNQFDSSTGTTRRICTYLPTYSDFERDRALAQANGKRDQNFVFSPLSNPPRWDNAEEADFALQATWDCDECRTADWDFDPTICSQTACNELLNPVNASINLDNRGECLLYNVDLSVGGFSQEAIALARANHPFAPCASPEDGAARVYCDAEKATATNVGELDTCGWLEGVYLPSVSRPRCIQEFCRERFVADSGVGWTVAADPYGCLDAICAPDGASCAGDLSELECREVFIATHGDPDLYAGSCTGDKCQKNLTHCLVDYITQDPPQWQYGDPIPTQCEVGRTICQIASRIASNILVSLIELDPIGPVVSLDPVAQLDPRLPASQSPRFALPNLIMEYRRMINEGDEAGMQLLRERMTEVPGMVSGLFNLMPERFVALFGTAGFNSTIGPRVHQVDPNPIRPQDLTPFGQEQLAELEELLADLPPDAIDSAFGTLRSQMLQVDTDGDGWPDVDDSCPHWANPDQADVDGNGIGDVCECGDQTGDGTVNVQDILAINEVIFELQAASPLCDTNDDGLCNVADILGANGKIFGAAASCARYTGP